MVSPELIIKITGNSAKFQAELRKIERDAKASGDKTAQQAIKNQEVTERNLIASYKRIALASAAVAAGAGIAIKAFANYESALVATARTTGLAGAELEKFKKNIDDVSSRLAVPREELFKIAEVAGTLGIKGADNLSKFTETMAKFDVASATLRGGEAANAIARIINLTGGGIENVDRFASEIAFLADNFAATEAEIAANAEELSRINAKIPLSTQNVIALSAAFAELGISPEIVRTGLSKFSSSLDEALREGGDKLRLFTALTGMTREELRKTFQESPEKVFTAFSQGLKTTGADATFVLSKLGLDQDRLAGIFLSSAQNVDVLTDAIKEGNEEYKNNSKLNEEVAKNLATTEKKWDDVKVSVGKVVTELGEKLAPAANVGFGALSAGFDTLFKHLDEDIPNALNTFASLFKQIFLALSIEVQKAVQALQYSFDTLLVKAAEGIEKLTPGNQSDLVLSANVRRDRGFSETNQQILKDQEELNKLLLEFEQQRTGIVAEQEQARADVRTEANEGELEQIVEHDERKNEVLAELEELKAEAEAEKRQEELEKKQKEFDEDLAVLDQQLKIAVDKENLAEITKIANKRKALKEKAELIGLEVKYEGEASKSKVLIAQLELGEKLGALKQFFGEHTAAYKAIFLVEKASAIARSIVATHKAVAEALATPPAPNFPLAAVAKTAGYLNVGIIAATAIQGLSAQDGGVVPGGFGGGDRVPALLEPGEIIVPQRFNPLSPNFEQSVGGAAGQNVEVVIGLDENASRVLTVKQREDSKLGIQS